MGNGRSHLIDLLEETDPGHKNPSHEKRRRHEKAYEVRRSKSPAEKQTPAWSVD
jgi:hypothetical protein